MTESDRSRFQRERPGRRAPAVRARGAALPLACLLALTACSAPGGTGSSDPEGPTAREVEAERTEGEGLGIVVLVVVDQLSADLLERYEDLWRGGFRRLLDEGLVFTDASHAHAVTETSPGHATISTGVVPRRHGIVANNWSEPTPDGGWRRVYSVQDPEVAIVGSPTEEGRSPVHMLRPGLADWVRATNPDAHVVSISRKDRAAVTMAGGVDEAHVYWISSPLGSFVTSTWYRPTLPGWVERVNEQLMPAVFSDTVWQSRVPAEVAHRTRQDTADTEGRGGFSWFPHRALAELDDPTRSAINDWIIHTPGPDEAVLSLALMALESLRLGRGSGADFLAVSFSQVDYVGHWYGPRSREQLDNLLRLDARIGRLLDALDRTVGEGRWVLALSADHGVMPFPEELRKEGLEASRLPRGEYRALVESLRGVAEQAAPSGDRAGAVAAAAERFDFVARAYTHAELADGAATDSFAPLFRDALRADRRSGTASLLGVELRLREGVLAGHPERGTTHGSPYWYDRHVPLVFLGAGVASGRSDEPAFTYDVAPTLAELAKIGIPADLDGRSLIDLPDRR